MKKFNWKVLLPHFIAVVVFVVVAVVYCKPAIDGKVVQQHDVTQWKGMAQNCFEYKDKHGHFPLWTNGMFSGMPSYQIVMGGDNPVSLAVITEIITLHLPKPMSFFFLACITFYFLTQVMRVNPYVGIMGALGYAYATYNPIIIVAGHDTKMMAIAYLPMFIGAILLIFKKEYWWGVALTAIGAAFLIQANHMQITYYAFLIAGAMSLSYFIIWVKEKEYKHILVSFGLLVAAGLLAIGYNAVNLGTTYEYSKDTIRGGSVMADKNSKTSATGLSKDYAFSYSMSKAEPLVLMFPYTFGGSSGNLEVAEDKSKAIKALQEMQPPQLGQQLQNYLQFYWGGIGNTSGPPYAGAIICFLALLGIVVLDDKYRWWMLSISVLAILMSWGQFFEGFNLFLLNHLPMYNKFRAPSMIMVIPTFVLCMMAVASFDTILKYEDKEELWKKLKKGFIIVGAVFAIALLVYMSSDFMGEADKALSKQISQIQDPQQKESLTQPVHTFISALKEDRKDLFMGSLLRSFLFILVPIAAIYLFVKKKINSLIAIAAVALFVFIDVMSIDVKYMNEEHFQDDNDVETTFKKSDADIQILKDTSYYRVFNLTQGAQAAFNQGALNSYYHKSIGGYHPAKLSIYQDLIEHQLYNFPNCMPVLNMLNAKYVVTPGQQGGQPVAQLNPGALGACWFVKGIVVKKTPTEVMDCLTTLNTKDSAVIFEADKALATAATQADSSAKVSLVKNDNDYVEYASTSTTGQFAVFSEVYYSHGWKAYIDGKEATIVKTNYVLRGLTVPAGNHKITFEFKPDSYYGSMKASVASSALIWLLLLSACFMYYKKSND